MRLIHLFLADHCSEMISIESKVGQVTSTVPPGAILNPAVS